MNQLRTNYSQRKEYYTNQMPKKGASNSAVLNMRNSPSIGGNSINGTGQLSLADSFNKMGLGKIGGLGGRMGDLEKASMRLGQAASQRRMGEAEQESNLQGGLLEKDYGFKKDLSQSESDTQSQLAAQSAGYSSPLEMQEDIRRKRQEQELYQKKQLMQSSLGYR